MSWSEVDFNGFVNEVLGAQARGAYLAEDGWNTVAELAELWDKDIRRVRDWIKKAEKGGTVEGVMATRVGVDNRVFHVRAYRRINAPNSD